MKTRSKLLLVAVSLLTVSVAATATSAYAWYTANRQVQANLNNVTTYADNSSLATELVTDCDFIRKTDEDTSINNGATSTTAMNYVAKEGKQLSDVSSSGNGDYVKPKWDAKGTKVVGWYKPTDAKGYSLKLSMNFWATSKNSLYLFVENTSVFTVPESNGLQKSAALSARYSITQTTTNASDSTSTTKVLAYAAPNETTGTLEYATGTTSASGTPNKSLLADNDEVTTIWDKTFFGTGTAAKRYSAQQISNGTEADARKKGYVIVLPGISETKEPQKVQLDFNIWIEGTDNDCSFEFTKDSTTFTASIELALNFYALENVTFKTEQTTQE